jgi:flagellar biosynthesis protein
MNATRYRKAVALEYGRRATPIVTARGDDAFAEQLIAQARLHGVHVAEDPALVAALEKVRIDQEIPREVYTAVAVILSWVYWLKGMEPGDEKR